MTKKTLSSDRFLKDIQGKNLNFLIGAGASVGLVNTLDLSELGESFEDLYSDKELNSQQKVALDLIWFKSWIQDTLITKEKIKKILEKNPDGQKTYDNYKKFVNELGDFLNREGYDRPKRANIFTTNYDSLFELAFDETSQDQRMIYFNDGSRGFLNRYISTENFNLNISHSAMSDNFQRNIPTINLLKIHGSITWDLEENSKRIKATINNQVFQKVKTDSDIIFSHIDLDNFPIIDHLFFGKALRSKQKENKKFIQENLKKELLEFKPKYPTILSTSTDANLSMSENPKPLTQEEATDLEDRLQDEFNLHFNKWKYPQPILNQKNNDNSDLECSLNDFEMDYKRLQVVNPTKDKFRETVFQQNYYQLLRMLSFELEKRDSILIIFGFSFADEHILEIIRRSIINPYLKVFVICYDERSREDIKTKLGNVGPNQIDFLPYDYNYVIDGQKQSMKGNFDYLNYLFSGRSNSEG